MEKTLQGAFNEFRLYHEFERGSRPRTILWHEKNIGAFQNFLSCQFKQDDPPVSQFNEDNLRAYLIHRVRDDKVSSRTSLNQWQSYKSFCRFLLSRKLIKEDPMLNIPRPKVERKIITYLREDEIKAVMKFMLSRRKKRYYLAYLRDLTLIAVLIYTGIRRSEALGLKISDINLNDGLILLMRTKTRRQEQQPIPSTLRPILKNYIKYRMRFERPNEALFIDVNRSGWDKRRGTGQFGERGLQLLFQEINHNVKLSVHLTPHVLRRSYATTLIKKTGNIFLVSKLLRHQDISTTVRSYAGVDNAELAQAAEKLKF
jgi:site-specific recombinase XerD